MSIDAGEKRSRRGKKRATAETGRPAAEPERTAAPAAPRQAAPAAAREEELVFEVCQERVTIVELPRIDEYVEDLIDPEFGLAPARETTRAAAKKLLGGFQEVLREMVATTPPKRRGP